MDRSESELGCIQTAASRLGDRLNVSILLTETIKSAVTLINKGFILSASNSSKELTIRTRYKGGVKPMCSIVCACNVGLYEPFVPCDEDFILADGGTFNVLRR